MSDPFRRFSTDKPIETSAIPASEQVVLSCKKCPERLLRSEVPPYGWVHENEKSRSLFDRGYHPADPDFIDVEVVE